MKRLLVVSYPMIAADRLAWIWGIRSQYHALNFQAIDPHFTLVFPTADLDLLNEQQFEIHGEVNRLDLVWDEDDRVGKVK